MVPYLLWCTFWFSVIYIFQSLPAFVHLFDVPLHKMSWYDRFWNLFLQPINYPFWYIRELMVYVVLSPVFFILVSRFGWIPTAIFLVLSFFFVSAVYVDRVPFFKFIPLTFFSLGAYLSVKKGENTRTLRVALDVLLLMVTLMSAW